MSEEIAEFKKKLMDLNTVITTMVSFFQENMTKVIGVLSELDTELTQIKDFAKEIKPKQPTTPKIEPQPGIWGTRSSPYFSQYKL